MSILIVVSRFNQEITASMLEGAKGVFQERQCKFDVVHVPGAFELPQLAAIAAKSEKYTGIVALGCVIQGETPHFDYVCQQTAQGLMRVSLDVGVPVTFGVLTTHTVEQAQARSGLKAPTQILGKQMVENKGVDAAEAVLEMVEAFAKVKEGKFCESD